MSSDKNSLHRSRSLFYNNRAVDLEKVKSDLSQFEDDGDDDIDIDSELDDILSSGKSKGKKRAPVVSAKKRATEQEPSDHSLPAAPARKRSKLNSSMSDSRIDLSDDFDDDAVVVVRSSGAKHSHTAPAKSVSYLDFLTDREIEMVENGKAGLGPVSAPVSGVLGYLAQTQNELRRSLSSLSTDPSIIVDILNPTPTGGGDSTVILEFAHSNRAPIKIRILKNDKLLKVVQVAEKLLSTGKDDTVVLKLKQGNIPLDPTMTPDDYDLQTDEKLVVSVKAARPPPPSVHDEDAEERQVREKIEKELDDSSHTTPAVNVSDDTETVTLSIRVPGDEKPRQVRIKKTDKLEKIVSAFASKLQIQPARIKLVFDGLVASNDSTPEDLEMEDEDLIDLKIS